jgi:methyl-accepting chemotaxis protein
MKNEWANGQSSTYGGNMPRLGLRWGLNVAFAGVASLTLVASTVAFLSYAHIGASLAKLEDDSVPQLTNALGVAREAAELSAISARMVAAQSEHQLDAAIITLEPQRAAMQASLRALAATSMDAGASVQLSKGIEDMLGSTHDLADAMRDRLHTRGLSRKLLTEATAAHRSVIIKLAPLLDDAQFDQIMRIDALPNLPNREAVLGAVEALDLGETGRTKILEDLQTEAHKALTVLVEIGITTDKDLLAPLNERFVAARNHIVELGSQLGHGAAFEDLRHAFEKFLRFGNPDDGVLAMRRNELLSLAHSVSLVDVNHQKAEQLAAGVQKTVQLAQATSARAVEASRGSIERSGAILLGLVIFNLLAAVAIAYFFVEKRVVRPLSQLKDVTLAVASGNFDAHVPSLGQGEIGRMAGAIEGLRQNSIRARDFDAERTKRLAADAHRREKIEAYIAAFDTTGRELSKALAAASVEMDTTARAMTGSAQEAGQEVTNVNAAAMQAADCVQHAAAAAEEMSQSIRDIYEKIGLSSTIALRAADEAKRADSTMRGMAQVAARIGEVVDLIRQVANQTNLLALNATIEAVRAGEAGRGFAVVAGEVKELATQTERATQDVAAQVAAIRATAVDAVEAMQTISATIEKMNEIAAAIAVAMAQQSVSTREIARAVQTAADSANQVNQSIRTVDKGVAGAGIAACRVLTAAADVGQRAEALQEEITQFLGQIRAA